jgi:hypothetical protein
MGTIPKSSSHPPFATEAAHGVRLLLFWPAVHPDTRPGFAAPSFRVLPVTAEPSGCPFPSAVWRMVPGRSVLQALMSSPGGDWSVSEDPWPKPVFF